MLDFGYYNMDCMQGMAEFPDNYFDLAIVDPPYGISIGANASTIGGGVAQPKRYKMFNDTAIPSEDYFKELKRVSKNQIIWGGNYFLEYLEATKCLVIWDKGRRGINFADCEIAWTSFDEPSRVFEYIWDGMRQENMKNKEQRIHPTQKPIALYRWCLEKYAHEGDKILDTHVGSASSLIACEDLGFKYVGFELDETYYKESKERLENHKAQISIMELMRDWKLP